MWLYLCELNGSRILCKTPRNYVEPPASTLAVLVDTLPKTGTKLTKENSHVGRSLDESSKQQTSPVLFAFLSAYESVVFVRPSPLRDVERARRARRRTRSMRPIWCASTALCCGTSARPPVGCSVGAVPSEERRRWDGCIPKNRPCD